MKLCKSSEVDKNIQKNLFYNSIWQTLEFIFIIKVNKINFIKQLIGFKVDIFHDLLSKPDRSRKLGVKPETSNKKSFFSRKYSSFIAYMYVGYRVFVSYKGVNTKKIKKNVNKKGVLFVFLFPEKNTKVDVLTFETRRLKYNFIGFKVDILHDLVSKPHRINHLISKPDKFNNLVSKPRDPTSWA
jgi:hypothetical protein